MLGLLSWNSELLFGAASSVSTAAGGMVGIWWSKILCFKPERKEGQTEKSPKSQASFIPALEALTMPRGTLRGQHRHEERREPMFKSLKCVFSTCENLSWKRVAERNKSRLAYNNKAPLLISREKRSEEQSLRPNEPLKSRLGPLFYHFSVSLIWGKSLSTAVSALLTNVACGADHGIPWLCLWQLRGIMQAQKYSRGHTVLCLWKRHGSGYQPILLLCSLHTAQCSGLVPVCIAFVERASQCTHCVFPS